MSFAALCGVAIALIDWDEQIIHPDLCNLLMWVGLLGSVLRDSIEPEQAIFGAVLGYGLLWVIQVGYLYIAKKDALGSGDLSLMGAIGAWVGPHQVGTVLSLAFFYVIAASALVGLVAVMFLDDPKGHIVEVAEDGTVHKINVG